MRRVGLISAPAPTAAVTEASTAPLPAFGWAVWFSLLQAAPAVTAAPHLWGLDLQAPSPTFGLFCSVFFPQYWDLNSGPNPFSALVIFKVGPPSFAQNQPLTVTFLPMTPKCLKLEVHTTMTT
jgi:hypothetical protein